MKPSWMKWNFQSIHIYIVWFCDHNWSGETSSHSEKNSYRFLNILVRIQHIALFLLTIGNESGIVNRKILTWLWWRFAFNKRFRTVKKNEVSDGLNLFPETVFRTNQFKSRNTFLGTLFFTTFFCWTDTFYSFELSFMMIFQNPNNII